MLARPVPAALAPGQESAWSYPRPAILEPTGRHLRVVFAGRVVAETTRALRVLETSHPPTYYFPPDDIATGYLRPAIGDSHCEWKGGARYLDVAAGGEVAPAAAWTYPNPTAEFRKLRNHVAFYAAAMDSCWVDGERAAPQEGGFYGGWITSHVAGPFKGPPGTRMW